jgi:hypothetical protein
MSIDGLHILDRAHFGPRVARRLQATGAGPVLDGQLAINIVEVPGSWRAARALRPFLAGESRVFAHRMYDHRPVRNPPTRF